MLYKIAIFAVSLHSAYEMCPEGGLLEFIH